MPVERNILWKPVGEVCAFSGYRPAKLPFSSESDPACTLLKLRLKEEIYDAIQQGSTDFVCGMALGTDTWAAETVLEIQQTLKDIKPIRLHAYLGHRYFSPLFTGLYGTAESGNDPPSKPPYCRI